MRECEHLDRQEEIIEAATRCLDILQICGSLDPGAARFHGQLLPIRFMLARSEARANFPAAMGELPPDSTCKINGCRDSDLTCDQISDFLLIMLEGSLSP